MDFGEGSVQRRNLLTVSSAIIVYFLADGSIGTAEGTTLSLPFVGVSFDNLNFLTCVVWASLIWFLLRYWQKTKGNIGGHFKRDLRDSGIAPLSVWYLKRKIGKAFNAYDGFFPGTTSFGSTGNFYISWHKSISDSKGGYAPKTSSTERVKVSGFSGMAFLVVNFVRLAFITPSFGNDLVPYLAFWLAIILGFCHLVGICF